MARRRAQPTLWIRGAVNTSEIKKELDTIIKETEKFKGKVNIALKAVSDESKKTKKGFDVLAKAGEVMTGVFERMGHKIVDGAIAGLRQLGTSLKESAKDALEFHKGFAEINTLIPGASKSLGQMERSALNMQAVYGQKQTDEIRGFYDTISNGFAEGAAATSVMNQANKLAVAGVTDVATAGGGLTAVLKAYNLEAKDAALVANDFFVALQKGRTKIPELANNIGTIAPTAAAAGVPLQELFGALAAVSVGGISMDETITAVNRALQTVIKPTDETSKLAEQLGIDFTTTALRSKGLAGFLVDLAKATENSSEGTSAFFGNIRALKAVLALTNDDLEYYNETMQAFADRTNAVDEGFAEISDSLMFKIEQWQSLTDSFGVSLLLGATNSDVLKGAVDGLNQGLFILQNVLLDNIIGLKGTKEEGQAWTQGMASDMLVGLANLIRSGVGWYETLRRTTLSLKDFITVTTYAIRAIPGMEGIYQVLNGSFELLKGIGNFGAENLELSETSKQFLKLADGIEEAGYAVLRSQGPIQSALEEESQSVEKLQSDYDALQAKRNAKKDEASANFKAKLPKEDDGSAARAKREEDKLNAGAYSLQQKFWKEIAKWAAEAKKVEEEYYQWKAKRQAEIAQVILDNELAIAQQYIDIIDNAISTMSNAFGYALSSVIFKVQTAEEAFKSLGKAIVTYVIQAIMQQAAAALTKFISESIIKTATAKASAVATISAYAGEAAAGAYAATAMIPFVGPALAPGVAATAGAGAQGIGMGFLTFAEGGVVPGNTRTDRIPALVQSDERWLTPTQNYLFERLMKSIADPPSVGMNGQNNKRSSGKGGVNNTLLLQVESNLGDMDDTLKRLVMDKVAPMFFKLLEDGAIGPEWQV